MMRKSNPTKWKIKSKIQFKT